MKTERLDFRPIRESDAEAIYRNYATDPEVTRFMTWNPHPNIDVTKMIVNHWLEEDKKRPEIPRYVILEKGKDEAIGMINVVSLDEEGVPEIGYVLAKKFWNKGYMTEACNAFVKKLFSLGYKKLYICADVDNIASNRVIEKCGFTFIGTKSYQIPLKGKTVTVNAYIKRKRARTRAHFLLIPLFL